jgi:hypothetical protein
VKKESFVMGSLMGGWSSSVGDPKAVKYQRNRSLTKEKIEHYWKSQHQKGEHDNKKAVGDRIGMLKEGERVIYQRSASMPLPNNNSIDMETQHDFEKLLHKNGWWVSSKWAFLNEKPVIASEGPIYKYASQYHVANKDSSKQWH